MNTAFSGTPIARTLIDDIRNRLSPLLLFKKSSHRGYCAGFTSIIARISIRNKTQSVRFQTLDGCRGRLRTTRLAIGMLNCSKTVVKLGNSRFSAIFLKFLSYSPVRGADSRTIKKPLYSVFFILRWAPEVNREIATVFILLYLP